MSDGTVILIPPFSGDVDFGWFLDPIPSPYNSSWPHVLACAVQEQS